MNEACLCYSCDQNYLLPTTVSAIQARRNLSLQIADVVVINVGGFHDPRGTICQLLKENGVRLQIVDAREIDNLSAMYARLFMDKFLDPIYKKVIHIDSDTQIAGCLDPLFEVFLPSGRLMGVPDPLAVRIHESGKFWTTTREYFRSIGIAECHLGRYVNTGLFGGGRDDMASASRECLGIVRRRKNEMRWHDQDGMNIVVGERFEHLSFRWNFPSFFMNCGFQTLFQPRVLHFMSNPRPWHGAYSPWGRSVHGVYLEQIRQEPTLKPYLKSVSTLRYVKYSLQQIYKRAVESRAWTQPDVLIRLIEFEKNAIA